ncbi:MAG: CBS domain-containing protein [Betaproteobacteria bacterium]|nr:MAG: CBS domain-containing protein [Betaproteobacteria bacterium]
MRKLICRPAAAMGLALLSPAVLAALEEVQTAVHKLVLYGFILFLVVVTVVVYSMRMRDKRRAPLTRLFEKHEAVHAVAPDASVTECVRAMTAARIGALVVMEGGQLTGIFTERDALTKVLATGRDPVSTKVSEVMTKEPCCIPPTTTVGEAMALVTQRRFRHLPIVENGKVLAVISSGDLTHWMVKGELGEVQELIDLAARS